MNERSAIRPLAAAPSSDFYRVMVEHSATTLYHLNYAEDRYEYVSPSVVHLTGFPQEHYLRTPFSELCKRFHPEDFDRVLGKVETMAPKGPGRISATFEYRLLDATGEWRWVNDWATMEFDAEGRLSTVTGSAFDISAQRDVLQALRESEQRYRLLAANSDDVISIFNPAFRLVYVSPSVTRALGWTPDEMLRMSFEDFMTPQALGVAMRGFGHRMALERAGTPLRAAQRNEMLFRRKDGGVVWFECVTSPLRDEHDVLTGILVAARDISERKEAEESLRRSEARLRSALVATSDGVFDILLPYPTLDVDPGCILQDADVRTGEQASRPTIHEGDVSAVRQALLNHLSGRGESFAVEYRLVMPHGGARWTLSRGRIVEWDREGGTIRLIGTHTDIQGRKEAEEALRHEEQKFRLLVENQSDVVLKIDTEGRLGYVSPSFCALVGSGEEELIGRPMAELVHPDDAAGLRRTIEILRRPPHGGVFEKRLRTKNGWRWMSFTDSTVFDATGEVVEIIGVGRDVTEQKALEADLRAAKEEAEAASRAKSEFLANMSHEIRNPLNAVLGLADLLLLGGLAPEQRERATLLKNSATSLLGVISDILDYSKIEAGGMELESEPFDPAALARSLVNEQQVLADEKGIGLTLTIAPTLPRMILGDGAKTRQILLNLLSNAIKFTDEGGVDVIVRTTQDQPDVPALLFAVADTGIGVPRGMQDAIFESFRQAESGLRKRHGGTGLGLAISRRLVQIMGGRIWLQSEPGKGSVFCFTLPVRIAQVGEAEGPNPSAPPLSLLLVEDDWVNRRFTAQLLEHHGHFVTLAENGAQAIEMLAQTVFDAVIMDMQMPVMDGLTATRCIRSGRAPDGRPLPRAVPVIGLTAYATEDVRRHFLVAGADACLTKPLRMDRLLAVLAGLHTGETAGREAASTEAIDLLDWRRIEDVLGADTAGFAGLLERFATDAAERLDRVAALLAAGDPHDAAMTAHSLAGAAGMVGGVALRRQCLELERAIRGGEQSAAGALGKAQALLEETVAALRNRP